MPSKSRSTKQATPIQLLSTPSVWPDAFLVGRLQALLAELEIEPREAQAEVGLAPSPQDGTATILVAIKQSKTFLLVRIDRLAECNLIRNDLNKIRGRLTENESRIWTTEDLTATHSTNITHLQRTVQALVAKSDNAENRLRHNNTRVLGLPEGEEGDRPAEFAEAFLRLS